MKLYLTKTLTLYAVLSFGFCLFRELFSVGFVSCRARLLFYVVPLLVLFINMLVQLKLEKDHEEKRNILFKETLNLFTLYGLALVSLLLLSRRQYPASFQIHLINLVPFRGIVAFLTSSSPIVAFVNIGGNLIALAPMRLFIPFLFGKKVESAGAFLLLIVALVVAVESLQLLIRVGSADVDDLILNTLGAFIAYMAYRKYIEPRVEGLKPSPAP